MTIGAPRTILVPIDLSPQARRGVAYAAMLAAKLGCTMVLTTNVNMAEREYLETFAAAEGLTDADAGETLLRRLGAELAPGIEIRTVFTHQLFPADGILEAAATSDANMIVMTSHGRSGAKRFVLGSVAERVARTSPIPVLIVPGSYRLEDE